MGRMDEGTFCVCGFFLVVGDQKPKRRGGEVIGSCEIRSPHGEKNGFLGDEDEGKVLGKGMQVGCVTLGAHTEREGVFRFCLLGYVVGLLGR